MLLATVLFAAMAVFIKQAAAHYGVGEIVFYRSLVTALVAWAAAHRAGQGLRSTRPRAHAAQALVGSAALGLYFFSITRLPLATAVTLNYMSSIWLTLLLMLGAVAWHRPATSDDDAAPRTHVGIGSLVAVAVGFAGVVLVLKPTFEAGQMPAAISGLLSGLLAAVGYLLVARLSRLGEPTHRVVFWFSAAAMGVGAALASGGGWHGHTLHGAALLLAVGLLGAGGQLLLTRAYGTGDAVTSASLQYIGVVHALVLGALVFGDALSVSSLMGIVTIVGAALVCVGLRAREASS